MKTAVSIPDRVFDAAERLAKNLGISRSELYAQALKAYLSTHERAHLTERMNQACQQFDGGLEPTLRRAQARAIGPEQW